MLKSGAFGDFPKARIQQKSFKNSIHGSKRAGKNIERVLREFTLIFSL